MLREVLDLKYLRSRGSEGDGRSRGGGFNNGGLGRGDDPRHPKPPRAPSSNAHLSRPTVPTWDPQPRPAPQGLGVSVDSDVNTVMCNCGQQALLLTVRKDGPNQGRQFYKCNGGTCVFFLWADQPVQQGASQSWGPPLQPSEASQPPRTTIASGNEEQTMCNCNERAVTRTVQKDGPNKGRTFHTCGKSREQQCGFFQWSDENAPPPGLSLYAYD